MRVDFLVPGVCGHSWTVSSVGAGAGAGTDASAGSSAGTSAISAISVFSSFLSENTESDTEAVVDFVWITRSLGISLTELYWTQFLSSLRIYGE